MSITNQENIDSITESINAIIKGTGINTNNISDGYHTFGKLYEHKFELYMALCRSLHRNEDGFVWKSKIHSDGSCYDGWFLLGVGTINGLQITYHLPISKWDECDFAAIFEKAPGWDGHTSNDVLERLKQL